MVVEMKVVIEPESHSRWRTTMKIQNGIIPACLLALTGSLYALTAVAGTDHAVAGKLEKYVNSNGLPCMSCHGINEKKVGPSWVAVSKKFHGQKNEIALLASRIQNGGTGTWGSVPMPPNMANGEQAAHLAKLIADLYKPD